MARSLDLILYIVVRVSLRIYFRRHYNTTSQRVVSYLSLGSGIIHLRVSHLVLTLQPNPVKGLFVIFEAGMN